MNWRHAVVSGTVCLEFLSRSFLGRDRRLARAGMKRAIEALRVIALGLVLMAQGVTASPNPGAQTTTRAVVILLTQVPCQFIESEDGANRGYLGRKPEDCERINRKSGEVRANASMPLELMPGSYVFRVTNRNVPYEVGFWLRGASLDQRAILPSVSGAGLMRGATRDFTIDLAPGEYVYSGPLNPTPDYRLIVRGLINQPMKRVQC